MRRLFITLISLWVPVLIYSQETPALKWLASEYVKAVNVKGPEIKKDTQGNIFTISTQVHLNPLVGFILIKYDPEGNKLWERNYEGFLPHLYFGPAIDPEGNAYVSINYGGLPGLPTYTILLKYAPDGELLWEISFEDWSNNVTNLLAAGPSGLLYFAGGVSNINITQGYYVGCLDTSNGSIIWKTEQTGQINPYNIKLLDDKIVLFANGLAVPGSNTRYHVIQQFDYDGELLATGMTEDTGFYGPDFNEITDDGDVLVGNRGFGYTATKISKEGSILWQYDKPLIFDKAFVRGLTFDDSLNTYITGGWSQYQTWIDFVTTKISPTGEILWENIYFASQDSLVDIGNSIVVDSLYTYAVGTQGEGGDIGSRELTILVQDKDSGEILYNLPIGLENRNMAGVEIILVNSGFVIVGISDSTISNTTQVHTGYYKFSHPVSISEETGKTASFVLYPNPARDVVNIQLSNLTTGGGVAEIFDLNGRSLMIEPLKGRRKLELDIGYLQAGMYVLRLDSQALKFNVVK